MEPAVGKVSDRSAHARNGPERALNLLTRAKPLVSLPFGRIDRKCDGLTVTLVGPAGVTFDCNLKHLAVRW